MKTNLAVEELLRKLEDNNGDVFGIVAELAPRTPIRIDKVRGVLLHAFAFGVGGLSRVVATQCWVFRKLGINVHLALSSPLPEKHCPLPDGVEMHYLPCATPENVEGVRKRELALLALVEKTNADVYLDSAYLNLASCRPIVLCDWMMLKTATNVRIVLHWHNVFSRFLRQPDGLPFASNIERALSFCDAMIVLSRVDQRFFRAFGCRVWYLPNPVDPALVKVSSASTPRTTAGKTVLWCARLSDIKRPLFALRVFAVAHAKVPDSKLIMAGGGDSRLFEIMNRFVDEHGLRDCVTMTGELTNTYSQYAQADVFLSTSTCEGYPVSFVEAYAFSLPIVSIGKGYLELLRDGAGAVVIQDDDVDAAGQALADVIGNGERFERLRSAALSTWRNLRDFDMFMAYDRLFRELVSSNEADSVCTDDERLMVRELVAAVPVGASAAFNRDTACLREAGAVIALRVMKFLFKSASLVLIGRWRRRVRAHRNACNDALKLIEGCK